MNQVLFQLSLSALISLGITTFHSQASTVNTNQLPVVRIATPGTSYPFNYKCDRSPGVCGIEIDLFDQVCQLSGLQCQWVVLPWATDNGPMGPGGMLYNLVNPNQDGKFDYDLVVASASNSPDRRLQMLFTTPYYTADHILIGHKNLKFKKKDWASNGFLVDRDFGTGRKIRISTVPGFLFQELQRVYGQAQFIEIVSMATGNEEALIEGKIDFFFAWSGIERKIFDKMPGGQSFKIHSVAQTILPDPFNAVAAATRIDKMGRQIQEKLNDGIIKVRQSGMHRKLFLDSLGYDLWPCRQAPYLVGDPKCAVQPK